MFISGISIIIHSIVRRLNTMYNWKIPQSKEKSNKNNQGMFSEPKQEFEKLPNWTPQIELRVCLHILSY